MALAPRGGRVRSAAGNPTALLAARRRILALVPIFLVLLGAAIFFGTESGVRQSAPIPGGKNATGTVASYHLVPTSNADTGSVDDAGQPQYAYDPIVEFETASGQHVTLEAGLDLAKPPAIGSKVPVSYDPSDPTDAHDTQKISKTGAVAFEVVGGVLVIAGVLMALSHLACRRRTPPFA